MLGSSDFLFVTQETSVTDVYLKNPLYHEKKIEGGRTLILVDETDQVTGSFKVRGAINAVHKILTTSTTSDFQLIAASSGNFGIGIAFACKKYNIDCTIYTPEFISENKRKSILKFGAKIISDFRSYESAKKKAIEDSLRSNGKQKFLDGASEETFSGNTSLIRQIDQKYEFKESDILIVPFGIGSLYVPALAYCRIYEKNCKVIAVEPKLSNKYTKSKKIVRFPRASFRRTIASGADVKKLPQLTLKMLNYFDPQVFSVSEKQIKTAMNILKSEHNILSEGAGVLGYSYYLKKKPLDYADRIFCIITGGNV